MTKVLQATAAGRAWLAGALSVIAAAHRKLADLAVRLAAALREQEPLTPEDYERELRERVFHPPQV